MLLVIRLTTAVVVSVLAAVVLQWTDPYFLKLGLGAGAGLAAALILLMWLTRTRLDSKVRAVANPLREVFLGGLAGLGWVAGLLLYFSVAANTPGLREWIVDSNRTEVESVVGRLEAGKNWLAASKVLVEELQVTHTPEFTHELAERAVIDLTRAAEGLDPTSAKELLQQALSIAKEHQLPDDLPRAILSRVDDDDALLKRTTSAEASKQALEQRLRELAATSEELTRQHRDDLESLRLKAEELLAAEINQATEAGLKLAAALALNVSEGNVQAARDLLAAAIKVAKNRGVQVASAEAALTRLDAAIAARSPVALASGTTAEVIRVHESPMPGLLLMDLKVSGATGDPTLGLLYKDFVATQGNSDLRVASSPQSQSGTLNVAAVFDVSESTTGAPIQAAKAAGAEFFRSLPPGTTIRVSSFSHRIKVLADWTTESSRAIAACQSLRAEGATALFAALMEGIVALSQISGEKVLVVFSDGANSITSGPTMQDVITAAKREGVCIHFVTLKSPGYGDTSAIESIATQTGGQTQLVSHSSGLMETFRSLADALGETGYRVALLDYDSEQAVQIQIGGANAVRLSVAPQAHATSMAKAK